MQTPESDREWVVAQIGARQHYAVARAMAARNRLFQLFTDAWCSRGHSLLRSLPDPFRSLANRYHPDIPRDLVTAYTSRAIWNRLQWRLFRPRTDAARFQHHVDVGRQFTQNVLRDLKRSSADPEDLVFFGYDTGCLEVLDWLSTNGGFGILDQIDPGRVEKQIVLEETERWPGWADDVPVLHPPHYERIEAEWDAASVIMVNSEWSKTALVEQGVSAGKIEVIPIAYEPGREVEAAATSVSSSGPLRVLWLGSVILRKGIQYLIQAAQQLEDRPIRFDVVGPIGISEKGLSEAPPNMTFHGRVPRDEADDWYARSDAFVLPTLSDGFAITQLEAMAHGLPVIATPNCGSVVDDGTNGRIVPVRDPEALAEAIAQLDEDRSQLHGMAAAARERVKRYHPQRVSSQLLEMVASRLQTDGVSH